MSSSSTRSPLFDANLIAMPLGPGHVAFVYPDGISESVVPVDIEQVLHLNGIQVDQASRQVYSQPESGLDKMARSRRATSPKTLIRPRWSQEPFCEPISVTQPRIVWSRARACMWCRPGAWPTGR